MLTVQNCSDATFLALALWREARGEPEECRRAIVSCILNRVARPGWWGKSVSEVLFKKWQFSSLTDPRDPQLTTWPAHSDQSWKECLDIAWDMLVWGNVVNTVPGADSYYDVSLDMAGKPPFWIKEARFVKQIGRVKFYDVDHDYEVDNGTGG